jgi:uncharacterized protein YndB with AHSA1/START domain
MSKNEKKPTRTRTREHRIEVRAPIEQVWKAIVDAEEITRWYAPEARVEPGEGGTYWVSWGEGMAGASRIDAWEPQRHLRLVHLPPEGADASAHENDEPIVDEYWLESDGDTTVVRLVQSGIPASADWDAFYEDTNRGWKMFLAGLRHYVEKHVGRPCRNVLFMHPVDVPVGDAWRRLIGTEGLAASGSLDDIEVGSRRKLTTAFGQKINVEVLVHEPPYTLSLTIDNLEDSLLALDFESFGSEIFLYANLSTFRIEEDEVEKLRDAWKGWIERLFPASGDGSSIRTEPGASAAPA